MSTSKTALWRKRLVFGTLAVAALALYPRYMDPGSGVPCRVEDVLAMVAADA